MLLLEWMSSPWIISLLPFLYYILPYLRNNSIRHISGPKLAAFSNLWLLWQCRRGRRYLAVDAAHKKYGTFVRIQPNHVSIADPEAIGIIYSHTGGWLKRHVLLFLVWMYPAESDICSEYYDAFVSIRRGLFNTRDRAEHTRKRKTVSHTFSAKSVAQFEPYIRTNLENLVEQWDERYQVAKDEGLEYLDMDCLQWFNYLAFDIIGDLVCYAFLSANSPKERPVILISYADFAFFVSF